MEAYAILSRRMDLARLLTTLETLRDCANDLIPPLTLLVVVFICADRAIRYRALEEKPPKPDVCHKEPSKEDIPESIPPEQDVSDSNPPKQDVHDSSPPKEDAPDIIPLETEFPDTDPPKQDVPDGIPPKQDIPDTAPPKQVAPDSIPLETSFPDSDPPKQDIPERKRIVECVHRKDASAQVKEELRLQEQLLQAHQALIEGTGDACLEVFRHIYKMQEEQLKQYDIFSDRYSDQFGSIVNNPHGPLKDIKEAPLAVTDAKTSLSNIIEQYRVLLDDNDKRFLEYQDDADRTFMAQEKIITRLTKLANNSATSAFVIFTGPADLIYQNHERIPEKGTCIDSVMTEHANLIAEYQKALDGLEALTAADHLIALTRVPSGWETLDAKDHIWNIPELAQPEQKDLTKGPKPSVASVKMIAEVQQIARIFRGKSEEMVTTMHGGPGDQTKCPLSHGDQSTTVKHTDQKLDTSSRMPKPVAAGASQGGGSPHDTLQTQLREEATQLSKAQANMDKLRAKIGRIQRDRSESRERHESTAESQQSQLARVCAMRMKALLENERLARRLSEREREWRRQFVRDKLGMECQEPDAVTVANAATNCTPSASASGESAITAGGH